MSLRLVYVSYEGSGRIRDEESRHLGSGFLVFVNMSVLALWSSG